MPDLPTWATDALAGVYDPCCREKGISVIDMGLVRSVEVEDGVAKVELLLTSGWCPFAATVLTQVKDQILRAPGIRDALKAYQPQLFICGHSHILKIMYDERLHCLHMNPGAAGRQGWHTIRTLVRLTIDGNNMKDCEVIELGSRS